MDSQLNDQSVPLDDLLSETPEDVAILYSWANLHGAKYRDFSASRREYRAQVRHRAAEDLRLAELKAKDDAEQAATEAERIAREAERAAAAPDSYDSGIDRQRALRDADDAARRAAAERVEAARRAESAALAEAVARREEREIAEAHASAQRQAARYHDHESRRRNLAGPQPRPVGLQSDPYEFSQGSNVDGDLYTSNRQLEYTQSRRYPDNYGSNAQGERRVYSSGERRAYASGERRAYVSVSGERRAFRPVEPEFRRRPQGYRPDEASGIRPAYRPPSEPAPLRARINPSEDLPRTAAPPSQGYPPAQRPDLYTSEVSRADSRLERQDRQSAELRSDNSNRESHSSAPDTAADYNRDQSTPAWLFTGNPPPPASPALNYSADASASPRGAAQSSTAAQPPSPSAQPSSTSSVADTLQHSRERVASRWFALKGVFEPGEEPTPEAAPVRKQETRTPALAVFSLAGGVGKTSMVATLGRALSSIGEKVLLADTTSHGLLPYYFGASELRPGVVRTFSPPAGSTDAPIHLVSYDLDGRSSDRGAQDAFVQELGSAASGTNRILLDLNNSSGWAIRRLAGMVLTVLVPVAPDMNSVISLQAVERYFAGITDYEGRAIQPYYLLNQFDAALPLHLDVREVLRRQLGERLLPFVVRRAPAVSEALAEGMTVVDYAPEAGIAEDYMNIASWLRTTAAPASQGFRNVRWSER